MCIHIYTQFSTLKQSNKSYEIVPSRLNKWVFWFVKLSGKLHNIHFDGTERPKSIRTSEGRKENENGKASHKKPPKIK